MLTLESYNPLAMSYISESILESSHFCFDMTVKFLQGNFNVFNHCCLLPGSGPPPLLSRTGITGYQTLYSTNDISFYIKKRDFYVNQSEHLLVFTSYCSLFAARKMLREIVNRKFH